MADTKITGLPDGTPLLTDTFPVQRGGTANYEILISALATLLGTPNGWVPAGVTWTYASATSFTIAGDYSAVLTKGMKWKATNTTAKSGYILSATYSAPNTTVTICGDALAAGAITANYYSTNATPSGFTHWYAYTPTFGGFSTNPVVDAKYTINGNTCLYYVTTVTAGVSNANTFTVSAPIASLYSINLVLASVIDNSTPIYTAIGVISSSTITLYKDLNPTGWTTSNNKYSDFLFSYQI